MISIKNVKNKIQKTDFFITLAMILSVAIIPLILARLIGYKPTYGRVISAFFFAYDSILIIRYKMLENKGILFLLTFLLWMGATSLYAGAELSKAWGGVMSRAWMICIFAFLTAYLVEGRKKRIWFIGINTSIAVSSCIFFALILFNAYRSLFDPSFETNENIGMFKNGRLHGLNNANTIGAVAAITIVAGIILVFYAFFSNNNSKNAGMLKTICASVGIISMVLSILVLSLCRSRASILSSGIGVGLVLYKVVHARCKSSGRRKYLYSITIAFLAVLTVIALSLCIKPGCDACVNYIAEKKCSVEHRKEIAEKLTPYGYDYALDTLTDRTLIWPATINMLNEVPSRWLIGVTAVKGSTTFINYVYENRPELYAVFAHNGYLQNVLMYGLPGAALLLIILAIWCAKGIRVYFNCSMENTVACSMVPFAVIAILLGFVEIYPFPFWALHPVAYMFFAAAGCCSAAIDKQKTETAENNKLCKFWAVSLAVIFIGVNITYVAADQIMKYQKTHTEPHTNIAQTDAEAYSLLESSVAEEILNAAYWVENCEKRAQNANAVIMTSNEIEAFNYKNRKKLSSLNISLALEDIGDKFNGKVLKSFINDSIGEFATDAEKTTISSEALENALAYANVDDIGPNTDVHFAYSVNHTTLRKLPGMSEPVYEKSDILQYYDIMAVAELMPFAQVVVLYTTADGEWLYVLTEDCGGWVPRSAVAYCENKNEWLEVANKRKDGNFIVVTASQINLTTHSGYSVKAPMGTAIAVSQKAGEGDPKGYYLEILVSDSGKLAFESVFLPESEDVIYGEYLPYTQENLIIQAFKLLGDDYGWAGTKDSVDCSLFVKEVYACFGISLPRNSATQAEVAGAESKNFFFSTKDRIKYLEELPAGALLYFSGHISIYLGMVDSIPYCISSVGHIETVDMQIGSKLPVNKVTISNMIYTTRANGVNWLNSLESMTTIK